MILKKIFTNIWTWIVLSFSLLLGLLKFEKFKRKRMKKELNKLNKKHEIQKEITDIKEFQAIEKERTKNADEKEYNTDIQPNTTIRL